MNFFKFYLLTFEYFSKESLSICYFAMVYFVCENAREKNSRSTSNEWTYRRKLEWKIWCL